MKPLSSLLALAIALGGCQANTPGGGKAAGKSKASVPTSGNVVVPAKLAAAVKLFAPQDAHTQIAGQVRLVPDYALKIQAGQMIGNNRVIAASAKLVDRNGKVISNDGASVISNDGASVISNDGASVISNDGASVISNDGASLISRDGSTIVAAGAGNIIAPADLISQDGGGAISNDGASIVAAGAGNIVAAGAGNIVAAGAGNLTSPRQLLEQSDPKNLKPAAGMALYVRSLVTHKPIRLGVDDQGHDAYVIYTDLNGKYAIYLPDGIKEENVEVVAFVPGRPDYRLHFNTVLPKTENKDSVVDDDTTQTINYVRFGMRSILKAFLKKSGADFSNAIKTLDCHADRPENQSMFITIAAGADFIRPQINFPAEFLNDDEIVTRTAERITDILLARRPLLSLKFMPKYTPTQGQAECFTPTNRNSVIATLNEISRLQREELSIAFNKDNIEQTVSNLRTVPLVQDWKTTHNGKDWIFDTPLDFQTFFCKSVFETVEGPQKLKLQNVCAASVDSPEECPDKAGGQRHLMEKAASINYSDGTHRDRQRWFNACYKTIGFQFMLDLISGGDELFNQIEKEVIAPLRK